MPASITFIIAKSGLDHSYTTPQEIKNLYHHIAPISPNGMDLNLHRDNRYIGKLVSVRFVEHENGVFIEGEADIEDEYVLGLPPTYIDQTLRRSFLDAMEAISA